MPTRPTTSHAPSRTHPGCAVIPAALAVAERVHASGEQFLRAVVLGYDVGARLNYALGPEAFAATSRSTHSFGGVFGAGAAAGALLGLDAVRVRHLLSFCAQQASGVACHVRDQDHIEKAFDFGGMPARGGVTAATMVAHGFTGVDDVFSGERNFFEAYAPEPDPAKLADALGERFEILRTNIKKWSVGSPAQSALDALTQIIDSAKPAGGRDRGDPRASADALGAHRRQCADAGRQRAASAGAAPGRWRADVSFRARPRAAARPRGPCRPPQGRNRSERRTDGGAAAPSGDRGDRTARRPHAVASHARGPRHRRQPDDAGGGRSQGARSDGRRARSRTRAKARGGDAARSNTLATCANCAPIGKSRPTAAGRSS